VGGWGGLEKLNAAKVGRTHKRKDTVMGTGRDVCETNSQRPGEFIQEKKAVNFSFRGELSNPVDKKCISCDADIVWIDTPGGRAPIEKRGIALGKKIFHWDRCYIGEGESKVSAAPWWWRSKRKNYVEE